MEKNTTQLVVILWFVILMACSFKSVLFSVALYTILQWRRAAKIAAKEE